MAKDANETACGSGEAYDPQLDSFNDAPSVTEEALHDPQFQGNVLYLFSGPERHRDGVQCWLEAEGIQCRCLDTEISTDHDLLDQSNWGELWKVIDDYDGRLLSPPCGTFSAARQSTDGRPMPLRSAESPGRYGLPSLRPAEKLKVRVGNVLAIRSPMGL